MWLKGKPGSPPDSQRHHKARQQTRELHVNRKLLWGWWLIIRGTYIYVVRMRGSNPLAQYCVIKMMIRDFWVRDEDPGWLCNCKVKTCNTCFRLQNVETDLKPEPCWWGGWIVSGTAYAWVYSTSIRFNLLASCQPWSSPMLLVQHWWGMRVVQHIVPGSLTELQISSLSKAVGEIWNDSMKLDVHPLLFFFFLLWLASHQLTDVL